MRYKDSTYKIEALKSRLFLIVLQYVANILIPDHHPEVFHFTKTTQEYSIIDKVIFHIFGGFLRWDAQYFVHISIYGYSYENTVAFFPLLPITIGVVSNFFHHFVSFISIEAISLLLYIIFNIIVFQLATIQLYKLTLLLFNGRTAHVAALLFCYNPASIFFVAPYTESLFSLLSFRVMLWCLKLYEKYRNHKSKINLIDGLVIIPTGLSLLTRSNGILNIGFIIFTFICLLKESLPLGGFRTKFLHFTSYICVTFCCAALSLVPFVFYQIYCYYRFCSNFDIDLPHTVKEYGISQRYVLPGEFNKYNQSWCYSQIPLAYSYVQQHYWNVGFLRYYELKQIPNFILAAPIVLFLMQKCIVHMYVNFDNKLLNYFVMHKNVIRHKKIRLHIVDPVLNVFVIHAFVLCTFCLLFVHIQVSTRMLCSASPVLYWYCAVYLDASSLKSLYWTYQSKSELLVKVYFLSYYIIGTVLFCNFLPWT